jgi:hypothetical protein
VCLGLVLICRRAALLALRSRRRYFALWCLHCRKCLVVYTLYSRSNKDFERSSPPPVSQGVTLISSTGVVLVQMSSIFDAIDNYFMRRGVLHRERVGCCASCGSPRSGGRRGSSPNADASELSEVACLVSRQTQKRRHPLSLAIKLSGLVGTIGCQTP